jgi:hypothetical protein
MLREAGPGRRTRRSALVAFSSSGNAPARRSGNIVDTASSGAGTADNAIAGTAANGIIAPGQTIGLGLGRLAHRLHVLRAASRAHALLGVENAALHRLLAGGDRGQGQPVTTLIAYSR